MSGPRIARQFAALAAAVTTLAALLLVTGGCKPNEPQPLAAATTSPAGVPPASTGGAPVADPSLLLREYAVPPYTLRLAIGDCQESGCPYRVELFRQAALLDVYTLPKASLSHDVEELPMDVTLPGDPSLMAWAAEVPEESEYVATTATTVRLSAQRLGLLVSQLYGDESLQRLNVLLLVDGEKLVPAWQDVPGSAANLTRILPSPEGKLGFVVGKRSADTRLATATSMVQIVQDSASGKIDQRALPRPDFPLYLLRVGAYDTPAAALEAASDCGLGLPVLDGKNYSLSPTRHFLGELFTQRNYADAMAQTIEECDSDLAVVVDEYTATPGA